MSGSEPVCVKGSSVPSTDPGRPLYVYITLCRPPFLVRCTLPSLPVTPPSLPLTAAGPRACCVAVGDRGDLRALSVLSGRAVRVGAASGSTRLPGVHK